MTKAAYEKSRNPAKSYGTDYDRTAAYRRQGAGKGIDDYGSKAAPQPKKADPLANRRYGKKNPAKEDYNVGGADYRKAQDEAKGSAMKLDDAKYGEYVKAIKGGATPSTAYGLASKGDKAKPLRNKGREAAERMKKRDNDKYMNSKN